MLTARAMGSDVEGEGDSGIHLAPSLAAFVVRPVGGGADELDFICVEKERTSDGENRGILF